MPNLKNTAQNGLIAQYKRYNGKHIKENKKTNKDPKHSAVEYQKSLNFSQGKNRIAKNLFRENCHAQAIFSFCLKFMVSKFYF